jgi:hypothetical protein
MAADPDMSLPRAQELTEFITFKTTGGAVSAALKTAVTTVTFASAWARITEGGGPIEPNDQQHEIQTQTFEVITQHIEGVTGFMEIAWGTRTLVITEAPQKILDKNNRSWMIIHAEEVIERSL